MTSWRVFKTLRKTEYYELMALFLLQGAALAAWFVPLGTVLDANGLGGYKALAYAGSALAAFISPLIFGAMADRHASPVKVLRGLALATAVAMALASGAIHWHLNPWIVLACIQFHALCSAPNWSIASTIVFARLQDAKREFGPVRSMGTIGWMAGCWLVSLFGADSSPSAGLIGTVLWLLVAAFTFCLPPMEVPPAAEHLSWHERLGLDALTLLRHREHRVVFLATALFAIPIAAFYPYSTAHLQALGFAHTSAVMSLGQVTEVASMLCVGVLLLRWPVKYVFLIGLCAGVIRFALSALDTPGWLLVGVSLHGISFVFFFITAQIYLEQRIEPAWRARAQALMTLVNSGFGSLAGYLLCGAWFRHCDQSPHADWPRFWTGISGAVAVVLLCFWLAYPAGNAKLQKRRAGE